MPCRVKINSLPGVGDSSIESQFLNSPIISLLTSVIFSPFLFLKTRSPGIVWFSPQKDFFHRGGHEGFPGVLVFRIIDIDNLLIEIQIMAPQSEYLGLALMPVCRPIMVMSCQSRGSYPSTWPAIDWPPLL